MRISMQFRRSLIILVPTLWFCVFLVLPFLFVLKISLATALYNNPPFTNLISFDQNIINIKISLQNYLTLFQSPVFIFAFMSSIKFALLTTIACAFLGYPIAYALSNTPDKWKNFLFIIIILPYWTSFLLRAYAWTNLLAKQGLINDFLLSTGLIHLPIRMLYTNFSVSIGLIYGYLPYFILPVYAALIKLDRSLIEAAQDLGARPLTAFFKITIPMTLPGIMAGGLLVFIPTTGEVVIPQILGGLNTLMMGNLIWQEFFTADDWPLASALAITMLILLLLPIIIFERIQLKNNLKKS